MTGDSVEKTIEHLAKLTDSMPSLLDLLYMRDLWAKVRSYWEVLCEEIERRRGLSHPIRALDFDIIYPTIWSERIRSPIGFEERMGFPMTASFIFRDTQTYFTIPPGALFELSFHILKLQEVYRLSESNLNRLMRKVEHLRESIGRVEVEHASGAGEVLHQTLPAVDREVNRLIDAGAKLDALSNILGHRYYRPWDEISQRAEASADPSEILKLWKIFSAARTHPEKDLSNYLDALSVASYYSLSRAQAGGRTKDFPLLASGTDVVLNLGPQALDTIEQRPSLLQEIIHPVSVQYLAFATAIEQYAEHDITVLSTLAEAGLNHTYQLFSRWRKFWNDCRTYFPHGKEHSEEDEYRSISFVQLADIPSFRPLCDAYSEWRIQFENTIGSVFIGITRSDRQMTNSYLDAKLRLLKRFEQKESLQARVRSSLVIEDVTSTFDWTPLNAVVDSGFLMLSGATKPAYGRVSTEAIELLTLRSTGILLEEAEVFSDPTPTLRTTIRLADIKEEVLLTWERSVGHASQLCYWSYGSAMKQALDHVGIFVAAANEGIRDWGVSRIRVFGEDICEEKTFQGNPGKVDWFDQVLTVTPDPKYIRIDTFACTVFFDVTPPRNSTHVEMAVMYQRKIHRELAQLYRSTSVFPLASTVIDALLREFADDFRRKEQLITSLATRTEGSLQ